MTVSPFGGRFGHSSMLRNDTLLIHGGFSGFVTSDILVRNSIMILCVERFPKLALTCPFNSS